MDFSAKWIYDIFSKKGALKSHNWFIPKDIFSAPQNITTEWLKAFFDDEAHVSINQKRIVLNVTNKSGLKQIQHMLKKLRIASKLNGPYYYKQYSSYHLSIYRDSIEKYAELISFTHPKKQRDLGKMVGMLGLPNKKEQIP